jgi:predicted alpha/beta superfamily hydrolase
MKAPAYTFVAGSSMGGLISLCAVMQYPQVFGGAGVFSPSLWISPQVYTDAEKFTTNSVVQVKLYFYAGGKESATMVSDINKIADIFAKKQNYIIRRSVSPLNQHNEKAWREEFPVFYSWLVSNL